MTDRAIDSSGSTVSACADEGRRRRELTSSLSAAVADGEPKDGYEGWYRASLAESLLQRALIIEHQEWRRHVEDLVRDALPQTGETADWWDEAAAGAEGADYVARVRWVSTERFDWPVPDEVWRRLEELSLLAEALTDSTRAARAALKQRQPEYFSPLDPFGEGDGSGRLEVTLESAHDLMRACESFWTSLAGTAGDAAASGEGEG